MHLVVNLDRFVEDKDLVTTVVVIGITELLAVGLSRVVEDILVVVVTILSRVVVDKVIDLVAGSSTAVVVHIVKEELDPKADRTIGVEFIPVAIHITVVASNSVADRITREELGLVAGHIVIEVDRIAVEEISLVNHIVVKAMAVNSSFIKRVVAEPQQLAFM